jgi:hypothetical protein
MKIGNIISTVNIYSWYRLREQLRQEWEKEQDKLKNEEISIAFSYWDGSGHRRDSRMKKGNTISQFLSRAIELLRKVCCYFDHFYL